MSKEEIKLVYVYELLNGRKLTRLEFIKYFEDKVFKTIRKFSLFELNDRLVVAVSGGKDSIAVLYLTYKYLKRKNLEKNVIALAIDEGIANYREHTLKYLKKFCKDLDIELYVNSYKESFWKDIR